MDASSALPAAANVPRELHPLLSLVQAIVLSALWLVTFALRLVTITAPRLLFTTLSYSFTLTLNFWSFFLLFVVGAIALNYWIRSKYLNVYARLKEPPLVKENAQELHPDVNTHDSTPAFNNYLDEFLQAVRVFGFLEKPVFHELARHLQTRRLVAGDSISLDQDKSFYCVVDGTVQVFAPASTGQEDPGTWEEEGLNGYRLLNEVGSGGTLSSLFNILSLFTEDVHISWQDGEHETSGPSNALVPVFRSQPIRPPFAESDSEVSQFSLDPGPLRSSRRRDSVSTIQNVSPTHSRSTARPRAFDNGPISRATSLSAETSRTSRSADSRDSDSSPTETEQGTVARAVEDSTLAVIPAEAFRRLTKKFPKATAHIVQVILTRLSRVTFTAAHEYLGLTTELLRTEKAINDIACHPLPPSFYEGGGLQYLRQRFDTTTTGSSDNPNDDYFNYVSSPETMPHRPDHNRYVSSSSLEESGNLRSSSLRTPFARAQSSRKLVQAGDLMGTISESSRPYARGGLNTPRVPRSGTHMPHAASKAPRLQEEDEFDLRDEVMTCIAKSIGLQQPPLSGGNSVEASPAVGATMMPDRSRAGQHPSPFGSLSSLMGLGDDMSTMTGASSVTGVADLSGLDNEVEILFFAAGSTLARAGERNTGLFYVIEGVLDVSIPTESASSSAKVPGSEKTPRQEHGSGSSRRVHIQEPADSSARRKSREEQAHPRRSLFTVKPGGIAGYLSSLCDIASYVDITAKTDAYVGFLPSKSLERLREARPIVLLTLAKRLISLLSPLVKYIDASLDWMQVDAGQVLWRPNDASDSFFIVINGRLRAISESGTEVTIIGEYGQGDTVGELDVITSSPRRSTVHAIRDTELIRMPQTLFNAISSRHPQSTAQILRMIASRVRSEVDSSTRNTLELARSTTNLRTVAIIPSRSQVPIHVFARKLHSALEAMGAPTAYLNQAAVSNHLGRHAFTRMGKLKAAGWLASQEQRYRMVLYVADSAVSSSWTQTCIKQADCVMVVGFGDDPSLGEYERLLLGMKTTARKELVLLHPDRSVLPGSTREWLKARPWIHQHIHVELPGLVVRDPKPTPSLPDDGVDVAAVAALRRVKERVQSEIQKFRRGPSDSRRQRPPHSNDFARLARRICGKSVGLVLGGGGARGIAHLGLIRALEEFGIPIDHIGGTSIGAFVGGLYAHEGDAISSSGRLKQFAGRMGNIWRMLSDVTYPMVAYTTGHEFNRAIYKAFYDLHIEDMWLPYFTNTSNIMTSKMELHETGYAWRFIRASMTLVGLLPPLCDNGQMLVDGGYMDNLPVAAMLSMGASAVIASDVGSLYDNSPRQFGDYVSGWWLLLNRFNPFSSARGAPAITEIQSRLAYVSSVRTLEEAKVTKGCLYMQMPVQDYGTLQWGKCEEILEKGYRASRDMLQKAQAEGTLPSMVLDGDGAQQGRKKGRSARRNSI